MPAEIRHSLRSLAPGTSLMGCAGLLLVVLPTGLWFIGGQAGPAIEPPRRVHGHIRDTTG
jgi:hypothetical protein